MALHNPEGMTDIINGKCYLKKAKEEEIRKLFLSSGFNEIETPCMEYFDMYYGDNEYIRQEDIFKFTDKTGKLLVLRPDMTVPACRVAATKMKGPLPYKLSYIEKCYRANDFGGGKQREFTQCGAEILGSSDAYYDAESIRLAVKTAKAVGIADISVQIGQVEFFSGLAKAAGFCKAECEKISKLIDNKDNFGIEEFLNTHETEPSIRKHLSSLTGYIGGSEMLLKLKADPLNERSLKAVMNLSEILDILKEMGIDQLVSIDLSMVKKLGYYTGMIFSGMTYKMGFPILAGGRYDNLCGKMGKTLPATGFSLSMEMAMQALERQGYEYASQAENTVITFTKETRSAVLKKAASIKGDFEILADSDDAVLYCKDKGAYRLIRCISENEVTVEEKDNKKKVMTLAKWSEKWNI
ncbi:MAG: ATP phosphoribosyltransferase regulatory subunit [Clostridia bacterium]|jgi:ATP phosphoribosyltransferase regulatory subunit